MTAPEQRIPEAAADGGEPVCLLHWVCADCGRLVEDTASGSCQNCGAPLPE